MLLAISSSLTVTISSTFSRMSPSVSSEILPVAIPSAIVSVESIDTGIPLVEALGYRRRRLGLDSDDVYPRIEFLQRRTDPPMSPPPPMGTMTESTSGSCSCISRPIVPLPCNDVGVVVRVDEQHVVVGGEGPGVRHRFSEVVPVKFDVPAVVFRRLDLRLRCAGRHHYRGVQPDRGCGEGYTLRVVAGARGDDA